MKKHTVNVTVTVAANAWTEKEITEIKNEFYKSLLQQIIEMDLVTINQHYNKVMNWRTYSGTIIILSQEGGDKHGS